MSSQVCMKLHDGEVRIDAITTSDDRMLNYKATCLTCQAIFLWTLPYAHNSLHPNDRVRLDISLLAVRPPAHDNDGTPGWMPFPQADVMLHGQYPKYLHDSGIWQLGFSGPSACMIEPDAARLSPSAVCGRDTSLSGVNVANFHVALTLRKNPTVA